MMKLAHPKRDALIKALTLAAGLLLMRCPGFAQIACSSPISFSTASPLPPGVTGTQYSQYIYVPHGDCNVTMSVTSGSLPSGLTLTNSGLLNQSKSVLAGVPITAGTFVFEITASQDFPVASVSKTFTLVVSAGLAVSTTPLLPSGVAGITYSQTLSATGGVPPYTWVLASGSLPPLLTLAVLSQQGGAIPALRASIMCGQVGLSYMKEV
jgi:hypothetical protein